MDNIVVASKSAGSVSDLPWGNIKLLDSAVVELPVTPSQVASYTRSGQNLVITLKSGEQITVGNFFTDAIGQGQSELVLQGENGGLVHGVYSTSETFSGFTFSEIATLDELTAVGAVGAGAAAAGSMPGWLLATLGVVGVGGAAAAVSSNSGSGGSDDPVPDTTPPASATNVVFGNNGASLSGRAEASSSVQVRDSQGNVIGTGTVDGSGNFQLTINPPLSNGETVSVVVTDAGGNSSPPVSVVAADTTPPAAVTGLEVNAAGDTLTGRGEAGATITVTGPNGVVLGTAVVAADGTFTVPLNTAQNQGQTLSVTATDAAGNVSVPAVIAANDSTAPDAPADLQVSADGNSLSGTGEAGTRVTVRDSAGNILGTGTVAADGSFTVALTSAVSGGAVLAVTLTDAAGNVSAPGVISVMDQLPPDAVTDLAINADGTVVSGKGEPGATVTVTNAAGTVLGTATVGADGTFSVTLDQAQLNGEALSVTQADPAGNTSVAGSLNAPDVTAPVAPSALALTADGSQLTGKAEAGSTVTVTDAKGVVLGSAVADADGNFQINLSAPQADGQVLTVVAKDPAGNSSPSASITVDDTTAPAAPTDLVIGAAGNAMAGKGEVGAVVTVKNAAGTVVGEGTVDANGNFLVTLTPSAAVGEVFSVTLTDAASNVSSAATVIAADAPDTPTNLLLGADGVTLTGSAEANVTITVKNAAGVVLGTAVAGPDGSFTVTLNTAQKNGELLQVQAIDAAGHLSLPSTFNAADTTPPAALTDVAISPDGATVTGKGEPGATVQIKNASAIVIGTATVDGAGNFSATLNPALINGEKLTVTQTDGGGNVSPDSPLTAPDSVLPIAVSNAVVTADGLSVTGKGEAGATVTVTNAAGTQLGSAVVGADGNFTVTLSQPQLNGEALSVKQVDPAGNNSPVVPVTAPDITAPLAPSALALTSGGAQLSGKAEAGSTVTVTDAKGVTLGSAVTDANGNFQINLSSPQANGQTLTVIAKDATGNTSPTALITVTDTTAPAAPTNLVIGAAGDALAGKGEAGTLVTVKNAAGTVVGEGTVDANGNFLVTLSPAAAVDETFTVTLTDAAKNVSPAGTVVAADAPEAPTNVLLNADGVTLTGNAQANVTITVKNAAGVVLGTAVAGPDGSFTVTLNTAQKNGELLQVQAIDAAGHLSLPSTFNAADTTPPAALTDVAISPDGATVTGKGEPGATVQIKNASAIVIGTATVDGAGNFSATLSPALINGEKLTVTQTDGGGNVSPDSPLTAPDSVLPIAVSNAVVTADGLSVTGKGEAGATVTVTNAAGTQLGSAVVGADGNFTVTLSQPQLNGEALSVKQVDPAGNNSPVVPITAPDLTAPVAPSALTLTLGGTQLVGKAEAGSTVTVTDAKGAVLGSAVADANGNFQVSLSAAQANGQTLTAVAKDPAGNLSPNASITASDTTAPGAATNLVIGAAGDALAGKGEVGAAVTVKNAAGTVVGEGTVDANGNFLVTLTPAAGVDESFTVTLTDAANNVSAVATVVAADAPQTPVNLLLDADGITLTGNAEANVTITVKAANGTVLGTVVTGPDGSFTVILTAPQKNGELLQVQATDAANHVSLPVDLKAADTTPPAALTDLAISPNGITVTGKGEAGDTVQVKNASGVVIGTATVGSSGDFTVTLTPALINGEKLTVSQIDGGGNASPALPLTAPDTVLPGALTNVLVTADGATVTGKGEAGATVTVTNAAGTVLGTAVVGTDGNFTVALNELQLNGEALSVRQADPAGNNSPVVPVLAPDVTAPVAASGLTLTSGGAQLSGKAEAGSTVTVTDAKGVALGSAVTDANGNFQINLSAPQANGQTLTVSTKDAAGNASATASITAADTTAPSAPTNLVVGAAGNVLAGSGEAGTVVTVKNAAGTVVGTGTVDVNGNFLITLSPSAAVDEVFNVTLTDAAKNVSQSGTVIAADAPAAPTDLVLNADGVTLTGTAQANTKVTVTNAQGVVIGSVDVGASGTFTLTLNTPQKNGELLQVQATDVANHASLPTALKAGDTTPPPALTGLAISPDGVTVTGKGEAGDTVQVKNAAGVVIGTATVSSAGDFTVTLSPALINGEKLNVSQVDAGGNVSPALALTAPDSVLPLALTDVLVTKDGLTVTGKGEAGATVTVTNGAGLALGTAVVGSDGNFSVTLTAPQLNGEALSVKQADPAGNASPAVPVTAPDLTAPLAPSALALTGGGAQLIGKAEAGSTVTVVDAKGAALGSAVADANGNFQVNLSSAQANGQTLTVSAKDVAGNVSPTGSITATDTTGPAAATNLVIGAAGDVLAGNGEAGASVTVKDAAGTVVGQGTVDTNGNFLVSLNPTAAINEVFSVTLTDAAKNVSAVATVVAADAPDAPGNLLLSADGLTLTGTSEANTKVTVIDATGKVLGSVDVGAGGSFTLTLSAAQINGEVLTVKATDLAGHASLPVTLNVADIAPPAALTNVTVSANGLSISGKGEANADVQIKDASGVVVGTGKVGSDGSFSFLLSVPQTNGQILQASQSDAQGNPSTSVPATAPDIQGPSVPTALVINTQGSVLTGIGEAGSTVKVTNAAGVQIGTAVVSAGGLFEVTLSPAQVTGSEIHITLTDKAGNVSPIADLNSFDTTAPGAPTAVLINGSGTSVSGQGEVGATVTVKGADGTPIGSVVIGSSGQFIVTLTTPQTNGEKLTVVQTDTANNTSISTPVTAPDITLPAPLTNVDITANGSAVTGKGEAGATVTVTDASGKSLGSALVDSTGNFSVSLTPAQLNGQALSVKQVDLAGNASPVAPVTAPDLTAPVAPSALVLSDGGIAISGKAEAGATVTVTDAKGVVVGSGVSGADGNFQFNLLTPQANGQALQVTARDAAGNLSAATSVTAKDTTAPDAPTQLVIGASGTILAGKGEAGASVTVKNAANLVVGEGVVDANGNFQVTLSPAAGVNQVFSVTLTDGATNVSTAGSVVAADAPTAPTDVLLNLDGVTLTGNAQANTTVSVKNAAGLSLGSILVGADGTFTLTLSAAQKNGELLSVTATDKAGHGSLPVIVTAADTTPPAVLTNVAVSADGLSVTGSGEAKATVHITDTKGVEIGTAVVRDDGTFTVILTTPQTNGQVVIANQTDTAGLPSPSVNANAPDLDAPALATNLGFNTQGTVITGSGEAGSKVIVTDALGVQIGTGTVNAGGTFEVNLSPAQNTGSAVFVSLTDALGHVAGAASIASPDITAPIALSDAKINLTGTSVTGTGEIGATVKVSLGSVELGNAKVGLDGTYTISLTPAQITGQTLLISQTDAAGNVSVSTPLLAPDSTAPLALTDVVLSGTGLAVTGKGEAGATVTITSPTGAVLGSGVVDANGNFTAILTTAALNGEALIARQADAAGNTSPAVNLTASDVIAPLAPVNLQLTAGGTLISGSAEAGSTVSVKNAAGTVLVSGTAGLDGSFQFILAPAQANGETLSVTASDKVGNTSPVASITATDTTAPGAPTQLAVSPDGVSLSGKGEAGTTVIVKNAAGTTIGTGQVDASGNFVVTLTATVSNNDVLSVTLADAKPNTSLPGTVIVSGDTPATPSDLALSQDGLHLTGAADVGDVIRVYSAQNLLLGTATVNADGRFEVVFLAGNAQLNGQKITVVATDALQISSVPAPVTAGDSTAPVALTDVAVNANGTAVTGKGEAGATVQVKDSAGLLLAFAVVAADGSFIVTLSPAPAQANGQLLQVSQVDAVGNPSPVVIATAPDLQAPNAPTALVLSGQGTVLGGSGEAGASVTVKDAAGAVIGTGVVNSNGTFEITVSPAQNTGALIQVTLADKAGNVSASTSLLSTDTSPPATPDTLKINATGTSLSGVGEAGATIKVTNAAGTVLGFGVVGADGTFTVALAPAQVSGQPLAVSQTDVAGNLSPSAAVSAPDATAPAPLTAVSISANGVTVSGKGESGATATVLDATGKVLGTALIDTSGNFSVTLTPALVNGEPLSVKQADVAGNVSPSFALNAPDITAPVVPSDLSLIAVGTQITGKTEAGATVTVTDAKGVVVGTGVAGLDGNFLFNLTPAQANGQTLQVTAKDAAGNVSAATSITAGDTTAPLVATELVVSADGTTIAGKGEAGSTVTIKDAAGINTIVSGLVDNTGHFQLTLTPAAGIGQTYSVTLTDAALNISLPALVTAAQAPATPSGLVLSADGLTLTGTADVNSTVTVKDLNGNVIGSVLVGTGGGFTVNLDPAQTDGQLLQVQASDVAGHLSLPVILTAGDTTAPVALTDLAITSLGTVVSGKGEIGASVTVTGPTGIVVGTGTVGTDGNFTITLTTPQANGGLLSFTQADAKLNVSAGATLLAPDITAPSLPVNLKVSLDGLVLTGNGEPGALISVVGSNGLTVGSGTVLAGGTFQITLDSAQLNGQLLEVRLTDAKGNVSLPGVALAPDTTPPPILTNVTINPDGTIVIGNGVPNAQVSIKDAAGNEIATGTVLPNGTLTIALDPAQNNGGVIQVTQSDAAGNVSPPFTVTLPDTTAPLALTGVEITPNGAIVTGFGEAGATVTVKDALGNVIGSGVVNDVNGFTVILSVPRINGEALTVVQTDAALNVSPLVPVNAPDLVAPAAPTSLLVVGGVLSGVGEPGATFTVLKGTTQVGTGTVSAGGTFQVTLTQALTNGEALEVRLSDAKGNLSLPGTVNAPDTTPPAPLTNVTLATTGITVTGSGEAGALVTVKSASNTVLGTGTVLADGSFTVVLNTAQINGERLTVIQQDLAGNQSPTYNLLAGDLVAPAAPTNLAVSPDGLTLSGTGQALSAVTVKDGLGATVGTGSVDASGNFAVTLNTVQINAQPLTVTLTDAGGTSLPGAIAAGDTTKPLELVNVQVTSDGSAVTGQGEPGAKVTVTLAGVAQGTTIVLPNGDFVFVLTPPLINGQVLQVQQSDPAGNASPVSTVTAPDLIIPDAPGGLVVSADGLTLTGTSEANAIITVTTAAGAPLGNGQADANGQFEIGLLPAQVNGQILSVVASDEAGNHSPAGTIGAGDITDPLAVTDLSVSLGGAQVFGRGEAGATVEVRDANNALLGTGVVDSNGAFIVTLTTPAAQNSVLSVVQLDKVLNDSPPVLVTVPDPDGPSTPTLLTLNAAGLILSGAADAGNLVTVKSALGVTLGTATVGDDGSFTVTLNQAQLNGEVLQVSASLAGAVSAPATYNALDVTDPTALLNVQVSSNGASVTGTGEVGAKVSVSNVLGAVLGTATVGADGSFTVALSPALTNGEPLTVVQADAAGHVSPTFPVIAPDLQIPVAPLVVSVNGTGTLLLGSGEAGASIIVKNALGQQIGTATADANGLFTVTLSPAQTNGQVLTVTQTDGGNNVSPSASIIAPDTTIPVAVVATVNSNGTLVSGTGEAGATIKVTNALGTVQLGTAVVATDGTFTVNLTPAQANGQALLVTQTDGGLNVSPTLGLTAPDITAPLAPTALAVLNAGTQLSGVGENGATVTVTAANGTVLGTGTVVGGVFLVNLSSPQLNGETLTVKLTDAAKNVSLAGTLTVADTTAPGAPTGVAISADGSTVTGSGVAGSKVEVKVAGAVIGTATVQLNGTFAVTLTTPQINTQTLSITQADLAGNVSGAASVQAPDLTPPALATALTVSADGTTLTGVGEVGATVTVKDASGTVVGTGQVAAGGIINVSLSPAKINGEVLNVTLADAKNNVSLPASVTAPDVDVNTPVIANDDLKTAEVTITPVTSSTEQNKVVTTLLLGNSLTFDFNVAANTTTDPTLMIRTSALLALFDSVTFTLQALNPATGTYVTVGSSSSGGLLDVVGLLGQGIRVDYNGALESGAYRLIVQNGLINVLNTLNATLTLNNTSLTQFTGTPGPAVTGNVITDTSLAGTPDTRGPDGLATLQILKNGAFVDASTGTVVQGLYGTLTIKADGSYSYTPNGSLASVGQVESFTYKLVHPVNGLSDTATLYVRIDSPQAAEVWNDSNLGQAAGLVSATDDVGTSSLTLVNQVDTVANHQIGQYSTGVLGGTRAGDSTSVIVAANTTQAMTVTVVSSGLLSLLGGVSVQLQKFNVATNGWDILETRSGGSLIAVGNTGAATTFNVTQAGTYRFHVANAGVVVGTTITTSVAQSITYANQYTVSSATSVVGNLVTDTAGGGADTLGSALTVLSVLASTGYVHPGYGGVTLTGNYGNLTVQSNGSYTYTAKAGLAASAVGQSDTFTYKLSHPTGIEDTATLTIDLKNAAAAATLSVARVAVAEEVHEINAADSHGLLDGTSGNDVIDGHQGGALTLEGHEGNDTLVIYDQNFLKVDGGTGSDTLKWNGGDADIDLANLSSRISNIEAIDLNHTSAVNLTISLEDVLAITDSSVDKLLIQGDSKDSVHLVGNWTAGPMQAQDSTEYAVYTSQQDESHHLWVQNGISVV